LSTLLCLFEIHNELFFASLNGKQIKMTEDHKITNYSERLRIEETGEPLKEGETRLYGMMGKESLEQIKLHFPELQYFTWQLPILILT